VSCAPSEAEAGRVQSRCCLQQPYQYPSAPFSHLSLRPAGPGWGQLGLTVGRGQPAVVGFSWQYCSSDIPAEQDKQDAVKAMQQAFCGQPAVSGYQLQYCSSDTLYEQDKHSAVWALQHFFGQPSVSGYQLQYCSSDTLYEQDKHSAVWALQHGCCAAVVVAVAVLEVHGPQLVPSPQKRHCSMPGMFPAAWQQKPPPEELHCSVSITQDRLGFPQVFAGVVVHPSVCEVLASELPCALTFAACAAVCCSSAAPSSASDGHTPLAHSVSAIAAPTRARTTAVAKRAMALSVR